MKTTFRKRILSVSLGFLLLFSLSLTAFGAGTRDLAVEWKQDQDFTIADPAPWNLEELKQVVDVTDPRSVAAYWVWSLNRLVENYDDGMEMMKYLFADLEPYGAGFTEGGYAKMAGWDSYFDERLTDPDYCWLPRAFFEGASASNGFKLSRPLTIELYYNDANTKNYNDQGEVYGRACIVYWVQSHAGGNQVNLGLMKFSDSDRWYVTNGTASTGVFYDQRSALTAEQLKLAQAGIPDDGSTAAEHSAFYGTSGAEPQPTEAPEKPEGLTGLDRFVPVNIYEDGQFADVASNFWGAPNIAKAYELGLMKGTDKGFDPRGKVTVAQAITMAARINSIYTTGSESFAQGTPWYKVYVDYAFENDLLSEYFADNEYNEPATRRQFAAILAYALPTEALPVINDIRENAIPDVASYDWHANAIYRLYRAGILTGSSGGAFNPDDNITRAEAAAIITRLADPSLRQLVTLD